MGSSYFQPKSQTHELYSIASSLFHIQKYEELIQLCRNTRNAYPGIGAYCYYLELRALLVQNLREEALEVLTEAEKKYPESNIIEDAFLRQNNIIQQSEILSMDEWIESFDQDIQESNLTEESEEAPGDEMDEEIESFEEDETQEDFNILIDLLKDRVELGIHKHLDTDLLSQLIYASGTALIGDNGYLYIPTKEALDNKQIVAWIDEIIDMMYEVKDKYGSVFNIQAKEALNKIKSAASKHIDLEKGERLFNLVLIMCGSIMPDCSQGLESDEVIHKGPYLYLLK